MIMTIITCLLIISCLIWSVNVVCAVLSYWIPQMLGVSIMLFAPVMIEWALMIYLGRKNSIGSSIIQYDTPKVFAILGILSFTYTMCNAIISFVILREGGPEIENGIYCLWNHGFVREITKEEYDYLSLAESRFATGHLLIFSAAPMLVFSTIRERKRLQKNTAPTGK